jgi:hypothetical protein
MRINSWVDTYVNNCYLTGSSVTIFTPWCLSKALELRRDKNGKSFDLLKKEQIILQKEIPEIVRLFKTNGICLEWWVVFARSYLKSRRLEEDIENEYVEMITNTAEKNLISELVFLDWEKDFVEKPIQANQDILDNFSKVVRPGVFQNELKRWQIWNKEQLNLSCTDEELTRDVRWQIACEAEEGRILCDYNSPLGTNDFILIPLEYPERFDNFTILAPDFKKRIVSALSYYPWRK